MLNFCSYLGGASSSEGEAQSAAKCRVSGPIGILYNYITYIQIHTYGIIRLHTVQRYKRDAWYVCIQPADFASLACSGATWS